MATPYDKMTNPDRSQIPSGPIISSLSAEPSISANDILFPSDHAIIFGAGGEGRIALNELRRSKTKILFFCDNDPHKHGTFIDGIEVFNPTRLVKYKDVPVLIASDWYTEISSQLRSLGSKKYYYYLYYILATNYLTKLEKVYNLLEDDRSRKTLISVIKYGLTLDPHMLEVSSYGPYLHPDVSPKPGEVIVDGGGWIGDTAISFANFVDHKCKIFSFEPSADNYNRLVHNLKYAGLHGIVVPIKAGLWNGAHVSKIKTSGRTTGSFRIDDHGDETVDLVDLDSFVQDKHIEVNLVKMDIEGAEIEALEGARALLSKKYAPKLQICTYHRLNDVWKIPLLVNSINPNYRFYLGHHSYHIRRDTIFYATCEQN